MQYDAFGIEIESYDETNQFANPFGYAGEYTDEETGNIYLRARYYDPSTGRFLSEDPAKDGTNWYAYAGNNPVLYVDPTGLDAKSVEYIDNIILMKVEYNNTGVHNQTHNDRANEMRNYLMYESPLNQYALYKEYITQIMETPNGGTLEQFMVLRDIAKYTAAVYYDDNPQQAVTDREVQNAKYVEMVAGIDRPEFATGLKNIFGQKTDPEGRRYWNAELGYTYIGNSLEIQRQYTDKRIMAIVINSSEKDNGTVLGEIKIHNNCVEIVKNVEPTFPYELPTGPN